MYWYFNYLLKVDIIKYDQYIMSNYANGTYYEHFIKLLRLTKGYDETYLWNEVPSILLIEHNVIKDNRDYRRRIDCGIDLVSQVDGKLYLIQCKYGYESGLRMHDLTGYFMFMGNNRNSYGIVYHTTDRISINIDYWSDTTIHTFLKIKFNHELSMDKNLLKYKMSNTNNEIFKEKKENKRVNEDEVIIRNDLPLKDQIKILNIVDKICNIKPIMRCKILELEKVKNTIYDKCYEYITATFTNDKLLIPYYYQIDCYKNAIRDFKVNELLMLSLPCGTGKTFASWLVSLHFPNILIISPLKAHSSQNLNNFKTFKTFYNNYGIEKTYKLINSDKDGNTDIDTVNEYLDINNIVISTTYKSILLFEKVLKKKNFLIIVDEFHNISKNVINDDKNVFHKILYGDENKKLLLSATPRLYEIDDNYCDLNTSFKMTYKLPFNIAIDQELICDYDLYFPNFDNGSTDIIEYDCNTKCNDKDTIGKVDYLNVGYQQLGFKKCIAYFSDTIELIKFYDRYMEIRKDIWFSNINVYIITSDTSLKDRKRILDEFSTLVDQKSVILSIRILDECIDIPVCDCIYFTYMCSNKIKNIQRLSRSIRKNKLNICKRSIVLIWCNNEYNNITDLLESIKEYDINYGNKVKILDNNEHIDINKVECDRKKKVKENNLSILIKKVIGCKLFKFRVWNDCLISVKNYINEFGKLPSGNDKIRCIKLLGIWICTQKNNYIKNNYNMKNINIKNQWEMFINDEKYCKYFLTVDDVWKNKLDQCKTYIDLNSKRPSGKSNDKIIRCIGSWLLHQIQNYEHLKCSMKNINIKNQWEMFINDEKYCKYIESKENIWYRKLNECKLYIIKHNNKPTISTNKCLTAWLEAQKCNYKKINIL